MNDLEIKELEGGEGGTTANPGKKRKLRKAPSYFRDVENFRPKPINTSIGPYHHGHGDRLPGNDKKEVYVDCFLKRVNMGFQDFVNELATRVGDLREKYHDDDIFFWLGHDNKDDFQQMMVVDGCYLLEMMLQARDGKFDLSSDSNEMETCKLDMLLVDNQIPIEVLEVLFDSVQHIRFVDTVDDLISIFFLLPRASQKGSRLHILDIYREGLLTGELKFRSRDFRDVLAFVPRILFTSLLDLICSHYFPSRQRERERERLKKLFKRSDLNIPSAAELEEAGIGITTSTSSLMDISVKRMTLRLPKIDMDTDRTTLWIFYQIILFERINSDPEDMRFSSYVYFMKSLLKEAGDCKILKKRGIISTSLDEVEVVKCFHLLSENINFSRNVPMDPRLLSIGKQLRETYNKNSQPWRKELWGKYLSSPWAVVSVIVALYILVLTTIQTVYTVLGYYYR